MNNKKIIYGSSDKSFLRKKWDALFQDIALKRIPNIYIKNNQVLNVKNEDQLENLIDPKNSENNKKWKVIILSLPLNNFINLVGFFNSLDKALNEEEIFSGNVKLMMSHVVPDLINKCLLGQDPLHILGSGDQIRHYTNGKDIALGIRLALESNKAVNEDFNISTSISTTVLELAEMIWSKINPDKDFKFISDEPYIHDVQKRIPDVTKAEKILGFKTKIELSESLDEVIKWMKANTELVKNE